MAGSNLVNPPAFAGAKHRRLRAGRSALTDDAKCFAFVRQHRWPEGVRCPFCASPAVIRDGCDETQPCRQRYRCKGCAKRFDDLTGTVLAGRHQPLRVWVLCLYFMGLNLSNRQIAQELDLSVSDVQVMTDQLRHGLVAKIPAVELESEVEIDESWLRSWLRPHRGISQEKLPDYLGFVQFVHNARRSGKALLNALITALVT
jgi:transposase-like protein